MVARSTDLETDVFARAIPGQSLTDIPRNNPYEKPPMTSSPKEAMDVILESLSQEEAQRSIINLLDAGISSETIASAFVLKMFAEGVFSPDVAEIIKPPLTAHITRLGVDSGVEDINVVNEAPYEGMAEQESFDLMSKVNPRKYEKVMNRAMQEEAEEELISRIELPEEEAPTRESFLDMGVQ
tara:strand:+ start:1921 stop:2469 length:549 start_codon:yes stop_codon:yes gene_type:complete